MQTKQQWFLDYLGEPGTQFTIPSYQRVYSWYGTQCEELWEDIMVCGRGEVSHYMSTALYLDAGTTPGGVRMLDIIDGQQRIASVSILLTALRDYLRETGTVLEGSALANRPGEGEGETLGAEELHERFLIVDDGGRPAAKVQLIGPDGATLSALVLGTAMPERPSARVCENYEYFSGRMREEGFDAQALWSGLRELLVIAAELDEGDRAQTIFECLNTKGVPLSAADLMRNYLLVGKTREEQQRLYLEYWQPMEIMFADDQNSSASLKLNTGLRMWLAIRFKGMCISDRSRTYHYFKLYMTTEYDGTVEELLDEMRSFCLLWSENYKLNGGRAHCSRFEWAKRGKRKTLVPRMLRSSDVGARLREERAGAADPADAAVEEIERDYEIEVLGKWGGQPIIWRVLECDDDSELLIAESAVDVLPYHSTYGKATWAECDLRAWANGEFLDGAFSEEERARLLTTTVHTPDDVLWGTVGGPDCEDTVFLLSVEEAQQYFSDSRDRRAKLTASAREWGGSAEDGYSLWWLRSPGHGQGFASTVWPVGGIDTAGSGVGRPGVGFRPAIRVKR